MLLVCDKITHLCRLLFLLICRGYQFPGTLGTLTYKDSLQLVDLKHDCCTYMCTVLLSGESGKSPSVRGKIEGKGKTGLRTGSSMLIFNQRQLPRLLL